MKLKRKSIEEKIVEDIVAKAEESKTEREKKTLYDIVDHNRLFSMLYSGVEDENNFQILYDMGIRNFLMSYHYVQKKRVDTARYEMMGVKFFIDSGAFTYITNVEYQEYTLDQWEDLIKKYIAWAEKHQSIIFAIANMDIDYIVGGEQVQKWNEQYFEPFMLRTGIPVCFVHHEEASKLTYEQYCQRYPYVGISWGGVDKQGSDERYGLEKLRIAEKYHSVVHGMAMTQTALLTKIPFYTVDSTTWLVGLQYGEVNYWTGQKMTRLKKDKWKASMLPMLVEKGFNENRLLEEDTEELIKVNVYAFIEAEKYIQERLKSRMYWLKPDIVKRKNLDEVVYPTLAELKDIEHTWKDLAPRLNISTEESEAKTIQNTIIDLTCFMNWDVPKYKGYINTLYTPELINEIHTKWINRIVSTDEEKVEDLKKFFTSVLLGENDKLLLIGTNFDRIVKERDEYITDEEYEEIDLDDSDVFQALGKYLPAPSDDGSAPEIDELDDEIFSKAGIVAVRDDNGRFLKGQRRVLKPKKMYSNKYPKMACDMCFNAQKCPEYKSGYVCAYNKMFDRYDTRDMGDIIQAMQGIAEYQIVRTQRAMLTETLNGGMPDANTTAMLNQAMGMMNSLKAMYEVASKEVIRQTKIVREDGSQEMTTSISNPQSGGILEKLFSNMGSTEETKEETKEEVIETPKEESAQEVINVEVLSKEELFNSDDE